MSGGTAEGLALPRQTPPLRAHPPLSLSLRGCCSLIRKAAFAPKAMDDCALPDLRDVELKLGRKVPESLARSLRGEEPTVTRDREKDREQPGGGPGVAGFSAARPPRAAMVDGGGGGSGSSALERLETKLHLLRQEMVSILPSPCLANNKASSAGSDHCALLLRLERCSSVWPAFF